MFDVVVASSPRTPFSERVADALKSARLRVFSCELGPADRPPSGVRVDAAVACAPRPADVGTMAVALRAALEGPPPVVGVTAGAGTPPAGTVDVLPDDAPASLLVARVQRAAASRERQRARIVLQGDLDDVGARELLGSLIARRRSCLVKIRMEHRRAEIALDAGTVTHARADGVAGGTADAVLLAISGWRGASFEVHGSDEAPPDTRPTVRPPAAALGGGAAEVALAAAVMNAVAAYARAFLPADAVAKHLEAARDVARKVDPGVDAFAVSKDGIVSVARLTLAQSALPGALATWCLAFFDACADEQPLRFRKDRIVDVLGGLTRLIEQVGWGAALLPRPTTEVSG